MKTKVKQILFLLIIFQFIFFTVNAKEAEKIYLIPINYNNGTINFGEIITKLGYIPSNNEQATDKGEQYLIELISFNKQILESKVFNFSFQDSPATLKEANEIIIFPYHKDGQELKVYDSNKKLVLNKNIAYTSDMCGDGICQAHESNIDCPKDCQVNTKDDYCNLQYRNTDPDCASFPNDTKNNIKIYIYVISVITVLLLSVFAFIWVRRKKL